jgi:hypothetical protein
MSDIKLVQQAENNFKREVASAMVSGARAYNLPIEADKTVYLVAPAEQLMVANAPIAGLRDQKIENLLDGQPVLFVYLSEVEFKDGPQLAAGFYAIRLRASQKIAEFVDAKDNVVAKGELTVGAEPSSEVMKMKRVSTDIDGPHTCHSVCVKVCLSLKIDLPGPWNPDIRICIEITIKV